MDLVYFIKAMYCLQADNLLGWKGEDPLSASSYWLRVYELDGTGESRALA